MVYPSICGKPREQNPRGYQRRPAAVSIALHLVANDAVEAPPLIKGEGQHEEKTLRPEVGSLDEVGPNLSPLFAEGQQGH